MSTKLRAALVLALLVLTGCTALQKMAALRSCQFEFANVSDVRLVGIAVGPGASFASLSIGAGAGAALGAVAGSVWRGPETWERVVLGGTPVGVIIRTGTERALGLGVRF